ncbi:jg27252 [Pararge aegeria aegeria]|uniref:Jg27252 protein n=1 Tax=Pararge aegeria aegeria TaxID=348720 RepID=A0A8S4RVC2_9NEOP|nr:jg27252 [Pararge aegeria aegeria]
MCAHAVHCNGSRGFVGVAVEVPHPLSALGVGDEAKAHRERSTHHSQFNEYRPTVETTLGFSTSHRVRPRIAAFTKRRDNIKEVRGYDVIDGDMNIRRREGHE